MVRGKKILVSIILVISIIFTVIAVQNLKTPSLRTTGSGDTTADVPQNIKGLEVQVLQYGTGDRKVKTGDYLLVRYEGALPSGTIFATNMGNAEPFGTYIGKGENIQGWEKGLEGMRINEKRRLIISPELGYGSAGSSAGDIPPNATLTYDIHLLDIVE